MKFESSQSHKIKGKCLTWLRLQQRCAFIATEVGAFSADVLGVSEKKMIEIEVKISMGDLRADFQKYKHNLYNGLQYGSSWDVKWQPSHFYYCVPFEMLEPAKEFISKHKLGSKYGIICADDMGVYRNPKRLHERESASSVKFSMALRMGSELIRFYEEWVR